MTMISRLSRSSGHLVSRGDAALRMSALRRLSERYRRDSRFRRFCDANPSLAMDRFYRRAGEFASEGGVVSRSGAGEDDLDDSESRESRESHEALEGLEGLDSLEGSFDPNLGVRVRFVLDGHRTLNVVLPINPSRELLSSELEGAGAYGVSSSDRISRVLSAGDVVMSLHLASMVG